MRVAISTQRVTVDFQEKRYSLRLDQLLLTGPLFDLLTMAKNRLEALFFVNPFILFTLSGIVYPCDEAVFIEDRWPRAKNPGELEALELFTTPALEAIFALRDWCQGSDACVAHWHAVSQLQNYIFLRSTSKHLTALPECIYSLVAIFRMPYKRVAYDLFINFFYARDIFDDFAQTGFLLTTSALCRNLPVALSKDDTLCLRLENIDTKGLLRWRYYDTCLMVYRKMMVWVKKQTGTVYTNTVKKKRVGERSMAQLLDDFLTESNLSLDMKQETFKIVHRFWSIFLWRLVSQDTDPNADPSYILFVSE
jgi:hypothetical protein